MMPVAEESLEMLGIIVYVYALLSYTGIGRRGVGFQVEGEKPGEPLDEPVG